MEPVGGGFESPISVPLTMTVEDVIQCLAEHQRDIAVIDQSGELRGRVTLLGVVNALAGAIQEEP